MTLSLKFKTAAVAATALMAACSPSEKEQRVQATDGKEVAIMSQTDDAKVFQSVDTTVITVRSGGSVLMEAKKEPFNERIALINTQEGYYCTYKIEGLPVEVSNSSDTTGPRIVSASAWVETPVCQRLDNITSVQDQKMVAKLRSYLRTTPVAPR